MKRLLLLFSVLALALTLAGAARAAEVKVV